LEIKLDNKSAHMKC